MAVTRDDVMHIAALARLALPEARVPELVAQLNGILKHMDVLQEQAAAEAAGGGPLLAPPPKPTRLRPDAGPPIPLAAPREQFSAKTLDGALGMRDGFYIVPRLATHEGEEGPK